MVADMTFLAGLIIGLLIGGTIGITVADWRTGAGL